MLNDATRWDSPPSDLTIELRTYRRPPKSEKLQASCESIGYLASWRQAASLQLCEWANATNWSLPWNYSRPSLQPYKCRSSHEKSWPILKASYPDFSSSSQDFRIVKSTVPNPQNYSHLTLPVTKDTEGITAVLKAYEHAINIDSADAAGMLDSQSGVGIS